MIICTSISLSGDENTQDSSSAHQDIFQEYYVMDSIPLTPFDDLSPKPAVQVTGYSEFNWMNYKGDDWTTSAKNQGPCGSCWAFAAVSCLESIINIAWNDPHLDVDLSEQYILSCLSNAGGCNGGNSQSAFKYIHRNDSSGNNCNGIITEESLEYQADDSVDCYEKSSDWKQHLVPIANYGAWSVNYPEDVDTIKSELIKRGPLVTYFLATGDFAQWGSTHHSPDDYYPYEQGVSANHAVIIVGFKDDPTIEHGGYWICKNSWGSSWGYNGFFNIEYGSLNIDNVEITWVEYEPYPQVDFTFHPKGPQAGETITFSDLSSCLKGSLVSWFWDFGDGITSTDQNPQKSYSTNGIYPVTLKVIDSFGYNNTFKTMMYVGDEVSPETSFSITGTQGKDEWYLSTIMIKLESYDSFSGVDYIMYRIDEGPYQPYNRAIIISGKSYPGEHTISYYAVDKSGNQETPKTGVFKLDATDPKVNIKTPKQQTFYLFNTAWNIDVNETMIFGPFLPNIAVSDLGSGIEKVYFFLNNKLIHIDYKAPYSCIINRFHIGKSCSFSIRVYDYSGRSTMSETIFFTQYSLGMIRNYLL